MPNIPGAVLVGQMWWYGYAVLRPAQFFRSIGLYPRNELGQAPRPAPPEGLGKRYSLEHREPVLLPERPDGYELVEDFDGLADVYRMAIEPFSRPVFEETVKAMSAFLSPRSRILDTSCGPGMELGELARLVPDGEIVGADLSAGMVNQAAANARRSGLTNVAFFQADVGNLPETFQGNFDLIWCSFSFHHYPQPLQALKEMRRVLRPGGKAFIVDAGPAWMKALASPIAKLGDPGWISFHTGEEFQDLAGRAGFSGFYWTEVLPGIGLTIATH
jgi:ubiquinone/menaquinone biosynthesis C-methylase UbiE